jgi:restriction system protein
MIRAGEHGRFAEKFAKGFVAIGWHEIGDLSKALTRDEIRAKYLAADWESKKGKSAASNDIAMIYKFRNLSIGDWVTTYNPEGREYLLGKISSDYIFNPEIIDPDYPHVRQVKWERRISRDALQQSSKN